MKSFKMGKKAMNVLFVLIIALLILWLLGLVTSYTLGGGIHILLALAVIFILVWLLSGR
jgi:hypothetical protein